MLGTRYTWSSAINFSEHGILTFTFGQPHFYLGKDILSWLEKYLSPYLKNLSSNNEKNHSPVALAILMPFQGKQDNYKSFDKKLPNAFPVHDYWQALLDLALVNCV